MAEGNPFGLAKPELIKRLAAHIGLPAETFWNDGPNRTMLRFGSPEATLLTVEIQNYSGRDDGWSVSTICGMPSDEQRRIFQLHKEPG